MFYKVLGRDGRPFCGGTGVWSLPSGDQPGDWMPKVAVDPCKSGYHLATIDQLPEWLGPELWVAEGRGEHVVRVDKHVFAEARLLRRVEAWNDRSARLFAADCAEHVLPIYERSYPDDPRPRRAIEVARLSAVGAARDAAWAAATDAAWGAARAARAAAREAAWGAERDAAWAAAGAAAREAAWEAAWAAAGSAARTAATPAAWEAERAWQADRLRFYLDQAEGSR